MSKAHEVHYLLFAAIKENATTHDWSELLRVKERLALRMRRHVVSSLSSVRKAAERAKDEDLLSQCESLEVLIAAKMPLPLPAVV